MQRYEYKVVLAPEKGRKVKGIRAPAERFAHLLEEMMNELGADGWEYWRAETLPSVERSGLTSSKTIERNLLIFRRTIAMPEPAPTPRRVVATPAPAPEPDPAPAPEPVEEPEKTDERMPVFTRRLEIAREQREALRREAGPEADNVTRVRPLGDD